VLWVRQESYENPLAKARVSLSHKGLELYGASVSITAQLNWLQYVMYNWFYTTAFLAILLIATMEATCLGFAYVWTQVRGHVETMSLS
jgi:hypothetical protein